MLFTGELWNELRQTAQNPIGALGQLAYLFVSPLKALMYTGRQHGFHSPFETGKDQGDQASGGPKALGEESPVYGRLKNPAPGHVWRHEALVMSYHLFNDKQINGVRKTVKPGAQPTRSEPVEVEMWGFIDTNQRLNLLNYTNGIISNIKIFHYNPDQINPEKMKSPEETLTRLHPVAWTREGEQIIFEGQPGFVWIRYKIHLYRPEDVEWNLPIDLCETSAVSFANTLIQSRPHFDHVLQPIR